MIISAWVNAIIFNDVILFLFGKNTVHVRLWLKIACFYKLTTLHTGVSFVTFHSGKVLDCVGDELNAKIYMYLVSLISQTCVDHSSKRNSNQKS